MSTSYTNSFKKIPYPEVGFQIPEREGISCFSFPCKKKLITQDFSSNELLTIFLNKSKRFQKKFHHFCEKCQEAIIQSVIISLPKKSENILQNVISFEYLSETKINSNPFPQLSNKRTRKMDRDCIHKKIKCRFFKYIKTKIKELVIDNYSYLYIPQEVICNATYKFNNWLFNAQVMNIFVEKDFYFSNQQQIDSISKPGMGIQLMEFINTKVSDKYEEYLQSDFFNKDLVKFKSENYLEILKKYSFGLIDYYNNYKSTD